MGRTRFRIREITEGSAMGEEIPRDSDAKVVRITYEYDDGSIREIVGKDAAEMNEGINGMFVMASIHGMDYKGPFLKEVRPPTARPK